MLDRMRACAAVCCVLTLLYFVLLICFLNPDYMALFLLFFSVLASIFLSNVCTVFTCASYAFARGGLGRLAARIQHRLIFFMMNYLAQGLLAALAWNRLVNGIHPSSGGQGLLLSCPRAGNATADMDGSLARSQPPARSREAVFC